MLKIAVLGTSNSILKTGYVKHLKSYKNITVTNFGIGDTASIYGIYQLIQHEEITNNFDYCIIDYSMNEYLYRSKNFITTERILFYIICIISFFRDKRCIPLFILLSPMTIDTFNDPLYRKIFHFFNIKYIDFDRIFNPLKHREIYENASHYISDFQKAIADKIYSECIEKKYQPINYSLIDKNPINLYTLDSDEVSLQYINTEHSVKKTSLLSTNTIKFYENSSLSIQTNGYLIGCSFWNNTNGANVYFTFSNKIIKKNFRLKWPEILSCRSILTPEKGNVSISLVPPAAVRHDIIEEGVPNSIDANINGQEFYLKDLIFSSVDPHSYIEKIVNKIDNVSLPTISYNYSNSHEIILNKKEHIFIPYKDSDELLISLNTFRKNKYYTGNNKYFQYENLVEHQKCNLLFLYDANSSFYLDNDNGESFSCLLDKYLRNFNPQKVTILGSSMGGYAALYFGIMKNINIITNNAIVNVALSKEVAWKDLQRAIDKILPCPDLSKFIPANIKDSIIYAVNGDFLMDKINAHLLRNCFLRKGRLFIEKIDDTEHRYQLVDAEKVFSIHKLLIDARNICIHS